MKPIMLFNVYNHCVRAACVLPPFLSCTHTIYVHAPIHYGNITHLRSAYSWRYVHASVPARMYVLVIM